MTETPAKILLDRLASENLTLCTAESCTGGMIASLVTGIPGASRAFWGGFVTYANDAKETLLGISGWTLETHGAVSEATVREMAEGALARSHADLAISVSGIAGPDGGTGEKPVGTVWLGVASRNAGTSTRKLTLSGDRESIRKKAAEEAIGFALSVLSSHLT